MCCAMTESRERQRTLNFCTKRAQVRFVIARIVKRAQDGDYQVAMMVKNLEYRKADGVDISRTHSEYSLHWNVHPSSSAFAKNQ